MEDCENDEVSTSVTVNPGTPATLAKPATLPSVTVTASFEKRKALQTSKAKLEKLRETLSNLR